MNHIDEVGTGFLDDPAQIGEVIHANAGDPVVAAIGEKSNDLINFWERNRKDDRANAIQEQQIITDFLKSQGQ